MSDANILRVNRLYFFITIIVAPPLIIKTTMSKTNTTPEMNSHFESQAALYEKMAGGATRRIAEKCLQYLPPLTSATRILDNASGPGIVTRLLLDTAAEQGVHPPPLITAVDLAPSMIAQLDAQRQACSWTTVSSHVRDSAHLDGLLADEAFEAVVMNFALFALPDAVCGAREMWRVLKPGGGVAVVTTWKRSMPVELLERTIKAIRPQDEAKVFPISREWLKAEKVRDTMLDGGFANVTVTEERTVWINDSRDELVDALTGPFWQRIWAEWNEEEKARLRPEMMKLLDTPEGERVELEMVAWICVAVKQ
jgi:ubiquinone/menaquinone biosynthesis C-methylase UbiE